MWKFAAVALIALGASACGSTTTTVATTTTPPTASIPSGWKTYAYGKAKISVPPSWILVSSQGCAESSAPGVLALGAPRSLANCPVGGNSIVVSSLPSGDAKAMSLCPAITVNGLRVHVLPCTGSNPRGIVQYLVPALGIEAVGAGAAGEDVTGPGADSIVGQVLHTLR
jgi:hypothetical protein